MKKILVLIFLGFILSGCASYKFQKPATLNAQGYLACYDGKPILEYTVGRNKILPDLTLAKERFKRRRGTVEYYYKQMDLIKSRLTEFFWDPPAMLVDLIGGVLRWPFVAVEDYKYNRDPKYKARVDKLDEQKDELEKARINSLKEKLAAYVVADLNKESPPSSPEVALPATIKPESTEETRGEVATLPTASGVVPIAQMSAPEEIVSPAPAAATIPAATLEPRLASVIEPPKEIKPAAVEPVVVKIVFEPPVAVIVAKPVQGNSPLVVKFSGQKSYSKSGKIISYLWDFGDGDSSTKKNPENTYYSTTFGARNFTATLSVKDEAGNISSVNTTIEVITK